MMCHEVFDFSLIVIWKP